MLLSHQHDRNITIVVGIITMFYFKLDYYERRAHPQISLIPNNLYNRYFDSTGVSNQLVDLLATPTLQEAISLSNNLIADEEIEKEQLLICLLTHAKQHDYDLQLLQTCLEKIALPFEVSFLPICSFGFTDLLESLSRSLTSEELNTLLAQNNFAVFRRACHNGQLAIIEWLWQQCLEEKRQIMLATGNFKAFRWACKNGQFAIVQWLWQQCLEEKRQIMLATGNFKAFRWACKNGQLAMVEWLWQQCSEEKRQAMLAVNDFETFPWACKNGQLAIIEWLWQECPEDEHQAMLAADNFEAFQMACENGHLKVVEWLWQECPEDEHQAMVAARNFAAFSWACYYRHSATIVWLLTNSPACLAYAEMHAWRDRDKVTTFLNDTIKQLRARCIDAADPSTLSLSTLERDRCFYLIRHLIRRPDYLDSQDHLEFLLSIPALTDVAHRSPNPQEAPNELLRLAFDVEHEGAALRLLAIPNVRQAAMRDYYYLDYQAQVAADLTAILEDHESSLRALPPHVRFQYEKLAAHYEARIAQAGGAHKILDAMRTELAARYTAKPACYDDDAGQRHCLPLTWDEFEALDLSASAQALALQAYYEHTLHTTWRYFQQPNPWQDEHATLVINGGADYRGYEPMLAVLWCAATDTAESPVAHQARDVRINHFITAMAMIARAHNWHGEQEQADGKIYECDDKKADKPSCGPGVNRRLGQLVELLFDAQAEIKTFTQLNQTLCDQLRTHFEQKLKHNPECLGQLKTLYDGIVLDYADLTEQDLALLGALNLTDAEIEQQVAAVVGRYVDTFNRVPLQIYVKDYFSVGANPKPNLDASYYQSHFLWLRHSSSARTWEMMHDLNETQKIRQHPHTMFGRKASSLELKNNDAAVYSDESDDEESMRPTS